MDEIKDGTQQLKLDKRGEIFMEYLEDFAIYKEVIREKEQRILYNEIENRLKGKEILIENSSF